MIPSDRIRQIASERELSIAAATMLYLDEREAQLRPVAVLAPALAACRHGYRYLAECPECSLDIEPIDSPPAEDPPLTTMPKDYDHGLAPRTPADPVEAAWKEACLEARRQKAEALAELTRVKSSHHRVIAEGNELRAELARVKAENAGLRAVVVAARKVDAFFAPTHCAELGELRKALSSLDAPTQAEPSPVLADKARANGCPHGCRYAVECPKCFVEMDFSDLSPEDPAPTEPREP